MRTITAKYRGTCKACDEPFRAGSRILYDGPRLTFHLECNPNDEPESEYCYNSPRTVSTVTRFSSGAEVYTNRNGRCEDAPCCGCCS